jgi:hypothetical protein
MACRSALPTAAGGSIIAFGVDPATSYGYISAKSPINGGAK